MAVPLYSYQESKKGNTPIVVALVAIVAVVLFAGVFAFAFYTPTTFRSSSSSNAWQDSRVSSATLACTGTCDLTGQFWDDIGQYRQIAQNGPGAWTIQRESNAIYWDIEWRIALSSTGSILITLNTGFVVLHLQGPTSNQGSWTTSTGQY